MDMPNLSLGHYDTDRSSELLALTSDFVAGDTSLLSKHLEHVDTSAIQKALDYLLRNPNISESQRQLLSTRAWSVAYKRRPPTIEEFLTPKYLGRQAEDGNLYPHVRKVLTEFLSPVAPYRDLVMAPHIGWGKLSAYDARVYTPDSYKLMRDVHVGDVVSTPNGSTATVIEKKDFPNEPLYRVTTTDGRTTIVGEEHLWKAARSWNGAKGPCWQTVTTKHIVDSVQRAEDAGRKERWFIPRTAPVHHTKKDLPIHPYTVGVNLLTSGADRIPFEYLYASADVRYKLLRGLLDSVSTSQTNSVSTPIVSLCNDIVELVRGLGGDAIVTSLYDEATTSYEIRISLSDVSQVIYIASIEPLEERGGACIVLDDEDHLYLTDDYIVTHNSTLSVIITLFISTHMALMRNSKKFFNQAPSAVLCQALISYSLKKSSEVLLEPFMNMLDVSEFFEKVHTREGMAKRDRDFDAAGEEIDRIFWTTATPSSALQFSNGANIKMISNVQNLLGLTIVSAVLSELSFFRDAGKALTLDTPVLTPDGYRDMGDIQVGDIVTSPTSGTTEVVAIPWEDEDDVYEIEFDNGCVVRCNAEHLWPVTYVSESGELIEDVVTTKFMIENPSIDFDIPAYLE